MSNNTNAGGSRSLNIMNDLMTAWRLLWDPRVPSMLKILLPVAAMVYWISPIDLIPGLPFDDIAVMIVALKMFINLAPNAATNGAASDPSGNQSNGFHQNGAQGAGFDDGDVIDTTWQVIDDD
jgi:uncharacterized membrane protein YkvA (DUF1232 family)